jgi:polyether ionophore transport system permease protein
VSATSGALSQGALTPARGTGFAPARALARRAFRDARTRTIAYGLLFALYAYIQPVGYRSAYPTLSSRLDFARSFGDNNAIRLFYGEPHDLLTVGGYSAWRVAGTLAIFAAVFGVLAAVRAYRIEEDTGRMELVLAGSVGRGIAYLSALAAIGCGVAALWLAEFAGSVAGGLPARESAYMALATASVVPVFVGVGALTSQLAPTRRIALELGSAVVASAFMLRVIADTASGVGWLRWLTPLGWAEEMRPFTGAQPTVVLLPIAASALLLAIAARIAARRDIGSGLLPARERAEPRLRLLASPTAQALRGECASLLAWTVGAGAFALITGALAKSTSSDGISKQLQHEVAKLGTSSIVTPAGYLGLTFIFFILFVSLFACAQIGACRHEESGQQLETLLSQPVGRQRWLAGRLLLAACAATAISLLAGLLTWVGVVSSGASVPLGKLIEAGANCLPVALLFLGAGALAYAVVPRASAGIAYGLVTVTFLWQLVGALLGAPQWLVELTPFAHVGLVPAEPFRAGSAAVMLALALAGALAALWALRQRDLMGP